MYSCSICVLVLIHLFSVVAVRNLEEILTVQSHKYDTGFVQRMKNYQDKAGAVLRKGQARMPQSEASKMFSYVRPGKDAMLGDSILDVNANCTLSDVLFEGDILLTPEQLDLLTEEQSVHSRRKRQASRNPLWEDNKVHYYFDKSMTEYAIQSFKQGAAFWRMNTCIDFIESSCAKNRLRVIHGDGCYSHVGRIGGEQELSLGPGCEHMTTAVHEIGHALGFLHTQNRYDRDEYIEVLLKNVEILKQHNFDLISPFDNQNYGMRYDYGSVMHYPKYAFSKNDRPTILALSPLYEDTMGGAMISLYDLKMMNRHYGCHLRCSPDSSVDCKNGGFSHPRNCNKCICAAGFTGRRCTKKPAGCGSTLRATTTVQKLRHRISQKEEDFPFQYAECTFWIQVPFGSNLEMKIDALIGIEGQGCFWGGLDINANEDPRASAYRFCLSTSVGTVITTAKRLVPVTFFNYILSHGATISYKLTRNQCYSVPCARGANDTKLNTEDDRGIESMTLLAATSLEPLKLV